MERRPELVLAACTDEIHPDPVPLAKLVKRLEKPVMVLVGPSLSRIQYESFG